MTEPLDLDKLEALLADATPSQYRTGLLAGRQTRQTPGSDFLRLYAGSEDGPGSTVAQWLTEADAKLLTAAVNALPALLRIARAAYDWADSDEADKLLPLRREGELLEAIYAARKGEP